MISYWILFIFSIFNQFIRLNWINIYIWIHIKILIVITSILFTTLFFFWFFNSILIHSINHPLQILFRFLHLFNLSSGIIHWNYIWWYLICRFGLRHFSIWRWNTRLVLSGKNIQWFVRTNFYFFFYSFCNKLFIFFF